jgi:hypothetical protein
MTFCAVEILMPASPQNLTDRALNLKGGVPSCVSFKMLPNRRKNYVYSNGRDFRASSLVA